MDTIIKTSYFFGDLNIPNATKEPTLDALESHIGKYESMYLTEILGYEMYKEFNAALTYSVDPPTTNVPKWAYLLRGNEFTDSLGRLNNWFGFLGYQNQDNELYKFSPIANYVYWQWMCLNSSQTMGIGEISTESENGLRISPIRKMARAWNDMVKWNWILHDFITVNIADYPDYIGQTFPPEAYPTDASKLAGNQLLFIKQNEFGI